MSKIYLIDKKTVRKLKDHATPEFLANKYPGRSFQPLKCIPCQKTLERWFNDGGCKAVSCGCWIEPDGHCEHGNPSWLMALGWI